MADSPLDGSGYDGQQPEELVGMTEADIVDERAKNGEYDLPERESFSGANRRSVAEIWDTGAAWVTETELEWLCMVAAAAADVPVLDGKVVPPDIRAATKRLKAVLDGR